MVIEYKGGQCIICGYKRYVGAFDLHHVDSSQKEFGLSVRGLTRSWEKIKAEADKFEALSKEILKDYVQSSSLIICSADDKVTQAILNRVAGYHDKPLIVPGLYAGAKGGEVVSFVPGVTPCLECTVVGRSYAAIENDDNNNVESENKKNES